MLQYTATYPAPELREDHLSLQDARALANIARRADRLWADGYTVYISDLTPGVFWVTTPLRDTPTGQAETTYSVFCGPLLGYSCTCPCYEERRTCKHLIACYALACQNAADEAQADAHDRRIAECEDDVFGCSPFAEL